MELKQSTDQLTVGYQFSYDEPVESGLRRIAKEEIAASIEQIRSIRRASDRDETIHEVRKSVKRVRGLLGLMRLELKESFSRENAAWREVGRKLSALRDGSVAIEVFDAVRQSFPGDLPPAIRRALVARKREMDRPGKLTRVLSEVTRDLDRAGRRVKRWRLERLGFRGVEAGFMTTYRMGQAALSKAAKTPSADNLHELRKLAKAHLYQVRLLGAIWDEKLRKHEARVRKLEELLGDHHNLHMLSTRIESEPGAEDLLRYLEELGKVLERKALRVAARVYRAGPSRTAARVRRLWKSRSVSLKPGSAGPTSDGE